MKISIAGMFGATSRSGRSHIVDYVQAAEELGFRALYVPEHVVFFSSYESKYPYTPDGSPAWSADTGIFDPLFICQVGAMATTSLTFCTGVLVLPQRPALLTAKEVLTLDHFSDGRFELGVGSGWSWEEYAALGVSFDRRGDRMDDYIRAIRAAWGDQPCAYSGEFVEFANVVLNPRPVTPGGPPIIVGGSSTAAMRRAVKLGDGWYGWWAGVEIEPHLEQLRAILASHNRAANSQGFSIRIGLPVGSGDPETVAAKIDQAAGLGVDELVLAAPVGTRDPQADLARWAEVAGLC